MRDQGSVHTVARALDMLTAFEPDRQELAVRDFAVLLDVHKSTASRIAATLLSRGYLQRGSENGSFRLGPEAARIGLLAVGGRAFAEAARPTLDALAAETGETVVLSVPAGTEALDVAQADSRYRIGTTSWIGRRTPLHASSDGKVLLAFEAARLPAGPLAALGPGTITSRTALRRELDEIRAHGWATALGECEDGLNGVASPIFAHDGECVGALSVSGPAYRMPGERLDELAPRTVAAAGTIGARLDARAAA